MKLEKKNIGFFKNKKNTIWLERNDRNRIETFQAEFEWNFRNMPRFWARLNMFWFKLFFELKWDVSAISGGTKDNWQPCVIHAESIKTRMYYMYIY